MLHLYAHWLIRSRLLALLLLALSPGLTHAAPVDPTPKPTPKPTLKKETQAPAAVVATVMRYVKAMASGDRVTVSRLDFACQFRMMAAAGNAPPSHTT